jgi:hypothetical protein
MDWVPVIVSWILAGASGLRSLATAVANAITAFWQNLVAMFMAWVKAFGNLMGAAGWLWSSFTVFVVSLVNWSRYMLLVRIPATLLAAEQYAESVGQAILNEAVDYARNWINYLYNLAYTLKTEVQSYVDTWLNWIRGQISDITTTLVDVARRVYALLTDPRALADWVAGEIIAAVFRWILGNAEALTRWAFARAITGALSGVAIVEQIIVDTFM